MDEIEKSSVTVILVGTDPKSNAGGIASVFPGYVKSIEQIGVVCHPIVSHHAKKWGGKWRFLLTAVFQLVKFIRIGNHGPVIVYIHAGEWPSLIRKYILLNISKIFGAKTILHLHAPEIDNYLKSKFKKRLFQLLISPADVVCVLTPWWKQRLVSESLDSRIEVIPNPLSPKLEEVAECPIKFECDDTSCETSILVMARLEKGKGVDLVIEAMPFLPDNVTVRIGGEGRSREQLQNRVRALGLAERVIFMGWATGSVKENLFNNSNVFCLPSSRDALCTGFVEAMAYGLPVVTLNWGGNADVVPHLKAGVVIEEPTGVSVAAGILKLVDKKIAHGMGEAGKDWVLSQYSCLSVSKKIETIIIDVVSGKGIKQ